MCVHIYIYVYIYIYIHTDLYNHPAAATAAPVLEPAARSAELAARRPAPMGALLLLY